MELNPMDKLMSMAMEMSTTAQRLPILEDLASELESRKSTFTPADEGFHALICILRDYARAAEVGRVAMNVAAALKYEKVNGNVIEGNFGQKSGPHGPGCTC